MLLYHHTLHKNCEAMVKNILEEKNIETKVVTRFDYNEGNINWADVIFTAGGDGTFLLGASKIHDPTKTIIGFNSDPTRSEGYLCLPKKYSNNIKNAIDKLLQVYWFFPIVFLLIKWVKLFCS
jgi:NAD+ kinase